MAQILDRFSGNVGIGTQLPIANLHVSSPGAGGTLFALENVSVGGAGWYLYSTGSGNAEGAGKLLFVRTGLPGPRITIDQNGALGVGTAFPQDQVHLQSGSSNRLFVESTGAGTFAGVRVKTPNREYFTGINTGSARWVVFDNSAGAERFGIESDGRIIVGGRTAINSVGQVLYA